MLQSHFLFKMTSLKILRHLVACAGLLVALGGAPAHAELPDPVAQAVGQPRLAGQGQMRFLGLRIYDARLWVGLGFDAQTFGAFPLALELTYYRAFSAQAIAERSVQEIGRQRTLDTQQAARWTAALAQWLPDVQPGDRLTGLYLPGQGMRLWRGGQLLGQLSDADLARHFFGIWLSPQTSEPRLRSALLAAVAESAP